ncbi:GNAT family N-acetyltransferase [Methylobacterium sp. 092160098-2]|jgi:GNAT superfamily N-acetyltransferase|uniref:GNAT family N-acetyltransferase n=1 Tax=Methylobacterium sp. 092160098-2 TaxID=3025129 RepID=UPI002381ADD0|nr:GNAT family N-acetyltransferase [Methylobacterium sp. 092160098-2]MDE4914233.1 GNAT family N-acetyltransferase [Methylobacterium sp. 092160098-2]
MNPDHPFRVAARALLAEWPGTRVSLTRPPFGSDPDAFTLMSFEVAPDRRGKGIGTCLLARIVEEADRHGVSLHVEPALTRDGVLDLGVAEWYARAGFVWNDPADPLGDGQMHRHPMPSTAPAPR